MGNGPVYSQARTTVPRWGSGCRPIMFPFLEFPVEFLEYPEEILNIFLHLNRNYNTCKKSFLFANFLKISWWNAIYTAVVLPAVTCRPVGGSIQTPSCWSFPVCVHKMVPWSAWFGREVTCFDMQHPSKKWVTKGFTSKGNYPCISSHQTQGYFITWGETWSHWHSWSFEGFFWSSFCSSKSFCNFPRTVRQRHGQDEWISSLSNQISNKLYVAEPPSRKWKHSPHYSLVTYAELQTKSLQGWTLPPHSPPHRDVSACNH